MQPYERSREQSSAPGRRLSHDPAPERSTTPIYDMLYSEYRRLFRALPGDRSGEDELRFECFGTVHGTGTGSWGDSSIRQCGGQWPAALPPASHDDRSL